MEATFSEVLKGHLAETRLDLDGLASATDIPRHSLQEWLEGKLRGLDRSHISRLTFGLVFAYDQLIPNPSRTIADVEGILTELLRSAGFGPISERPENRVWNRLAFEEKKTIKVGAPDWPPLTDRVGSAAIRGYAVELTERVCTLCGFRVLWVPLEWSDMIPAVGAGDIDLISPVLMNVPARAFKVRFSHSIPNRLLGPVNPSVAVVGLAQLGNTNPTSYTDSLLVHCVKGEVGEISALLLFPNAEIETVHNTAEEAIAKILQEPVSNDGRLRCFVADELRCGQFVLQHPTSLREIRTEARLRFPLAFAADYHEENLIALIDRALLLLENTTAGQDSRLQHSPATPEIQRFQ